MAGSVPAELVTLANSLADAARPIAARYFRTPVTVDDKSDQSPVTIADREAETAMRELLARHVPGHGVFGEEHGAVRTDAEYVWVLDPIDGTKAFITGLPIFGTLVALFHRGKPVLGIIDQPISGERWVGAMGQPTLFNGKPAATRTCRELSEAVLATTGPQYFSDHDGEHFMALAAQTSHKRMVFGGDCYNYALLASGHIDIVAEANLHLHDFAALVPIVEGAGGLMCDWTGEPLHAASGGDAIALGDPARLEEVLEALACTHS